MRIKNYIEFLKEEITETIGKEIETLKSTWETVDMYRQDFWSKKNVEETPGLQLDINGAYFHYSLEKLQNMEDYMKELNLDNKYPKLYEIILKAKGRISSLLLSGEPGKGNIEMSSISDRKVLRDLAKESIEEMEKELNSIK